MDYDTTNHLKITKYNKITSPNKPKMDVDITQTMDIARGKQLKSILDHHMKQFIDKHCECDPIYFVPIQMLEAAWKSYWIIHAKDENVEYHGGQSSTAPKYNTILGAIEFPIKLKKYPINDPIAFYDMHNSVKQIKPILYSGIRLKSLPE
jgi:hypothetical protein